MKHSGWLQLTKRSLSVGQASAYSMVDADILSDQPQPVPTVTPWAVAVVRFVDMKKGLVAIHAEVEVSRDYLQHLFCQNTPVIYEIEEMLKKYQIDYRIWNVRIIRLIVDPLLGLCR